MKFLCPLLLLAICGVATVASAATTKGVAAPAKSVARPQPGILSPQQQCIINKRKIMEAARRYYKTQYETKLLLIKLRVRRQQLVEKRVRYQNFLRRMRLRHKRRIQQRILKFKRLVKKARKQYRKKLRTVTKKFQRRVMRKLKRKPMSSRRLRFIKKAFFKRGIISKRAALIARKPIRPTGPFRGAIPIHGRAICKCARLTRGLRRLNSSHVNRKTRQIMLQYQNKVQRRVIRRLRYLMQRTKDYVKAQIEDQVRKLRLDKCCRGPGKRHILKRRIQEVTRRLQTRAHIVRQRRKNTIVRSVVRRCRKSLRKKLRKILRRVKRSRRRATRKLRIIQERILTGKTSRNWRLIQRLRQQRRRIIRRIQRRGKLIRRINRRRQRVIQRFRGRDNRRRRQVSRRREYRRTIRRRTQPRRRIIDRRWRRPATRRRRIIRKVLIKKVTKKVHIVVKKIRRALRKSLVRKRVIKRVRRRCVVLKRRIVRMTVKRRIIKRRIQLILSRRSRLIRRMNLLRLRRAALVKKAPKSVPKGPKRVIVKQTVTVAKRIAQKTAHINKRLRILAVRVSQASKKILTLKQRRVDIKKRIVTVKLRYKKLKFRVLVVKRKARSEVKKLRQLIKLKRKIVRRIVRRRIVSRRVIRRIERKERRIISRTVRKFVHRKRKVVRRVQIRKLKRKIQKKTSIHRKRSVSAVVKGFHSLTKRVASAARRKLISQSRILRIRSREIAVKKRIIRFRQRRVLVKRKIVKLKVRRVWLFGKLRAIKKQKKVAGVKNKIRRIRRRIAICSHNIHKLRRRQRKLRRRVAKNVRRRKILRLRITRIKRTIKRQDIRVSRLLKKILVRNIRWNVFGFKTIQKVTKGIKNVTKKFIKQKPSKPARAKKLPVKRRVLILKSRKQRLIAREVVKKLNNTHNRVQRVIRRLLVTKGRIVHIKRRTRQLKVKIVRIKYRRQRVKKRIAKISAQRARLIKLVKQIQSRYRKVVKVLPRKPLLKKPVLKKPVFKKPVFKKPVFKKPVAWKRRLLPQTRQVKRLLRRIAICSVRIKKLTRKSVHLKTRIVRVTQRRQRLIKRIVSLKKVAKARKLRFKTLITRCKRRIIQFKVANVKAIRLAVKKAGKRLIRRAKVQKQILRRKISTRVPLVAQKKRVIRILRVLKKKVAKRVVRQVKRVTRRIARAQVRAIVSRRRITRIVRRQVHLQRRIHKFNVRRRQLRRRIESVQIKRVQLVRRVKKLKLLKVKVQRLLTAKPKAKVILAQRLKRIAIQIKRSTNNLAVLKRRVVTLKKRRVHLKIRIARCVKREYRLRRRIVRTRHLVRRQVKRLKKIVVKERKFLRRMVKRRLISRQVVYRIEKKSRKVIKRYKIRSLTKRVTRLRRVPIISSRRVSIAGRKVVLPRLVTTVRRHKKGLKRKITALKSITKKLRAQKVKILRKLSAPVLIRQVLLQRPRTRVNVSLKKVTGGKKLLKVTKTEVVANRILHSKAPVPLNNLKVVQARLRAQLLLLNKKLTSAAPSFKKLVQQTKTAYETDEQVVNTGFTNSISEATETYNQVINRQRLLFNTEFHTLVTEELRTADEELDPLSNKWVLKSSTTDWTYFNVGCFKDQANRDLKYLAETSPAMTLSRCRNVCRNRGYFYFGVQNSNECRCGNSYGKHGAGKLCNKLCSGNKAQICGGLWHNNIYSTGVSGYKAVNIGCFYDKAIRDLPKLAFKSPKLRLYSCSRACGSQGYKFFGLQNGNECWCGNSYGKYGKAPAKQCTAPCGGGSGNLCGGPWLNNVYRTGLAEGGSVTQEIADGIRKGRGVDQESVTTETTSTVSGGGRQTQTQVVHGQGNGLASKLQFTQISTPSVKVFPGKGKRVRVVNPDGSVSWTETSESHVVTGDPTLLQSSRVITSGGGFKNAASGKSSKSSVVKTVNPDGSTSWTESSESQVVGSPVETSSSTESGWINVPS